MMMASFTNYSQQRVYVYVVYRQMISLRPARKLWRGDSDMISKQPPSWFLHFEYLDFAMMSEKRLNSNVIELGYEKNPSMIQTCICLLQKN